MSASRLGRAFDGMPTQVLAFNPELAPDVVVVVLMVVVEVYLLTQILPRRGGPPTLTRMIIGSTALLGSAGLLMALVGAFFSSNLSSYSIVLLLFNFMMLGPPGVWMIAVILLHDRRIDPKSWAWPVAIASMAMLAEALMGLLFTATSGPPYDLLDVVGGSLTSGWFLWSMAAAMVALIVWVPLPGPLRLPLLGLALAGVVAPWVSADPLVGAALMVLAMGATFASFPAALRAPMAHRLSPWLLGVGAAFLPMTATGLLLAVLPDSPLAVLLFGGVMASVMFGEFLVLVREALLPTLTTRPSDVPDVPHGEAASTDLPVPSAR
jgi:hypothetical protein